MECLEGYIGIEGCGAATPESGVYINSLPGISIEVAQKIADSEQITFLNAWNDITERAIRRFKTDVLNNLKKRFRLNIISQFINTGKSVDTTVITAAAAEYRGRVLKILGQTPSKLHKIYIEEVNIYFNAAGATTLYVIDEYGTTQYTKAITITAAGWQRVYVGQTFDGKELQVVYDATTINSVKTTNAATLELDISCYCQELCDCECDDCNITTTGTSATDLGDLSTYTEGSNSFGVSVIFGLRCSYDAVICSNREEFIEPLVLLHGVEFLSERIYSTRVNRFTTIDLVKAKELRTEMEGSYQAALSAVLDGMRIDKFDCCIECEWMTQYTQCLP